MESYTSYLAYLNQIIQVKYNANKLSPKAKDLVYLRYTWFIFIN
jgi:hypothetical protein